MEINYSILIKEYREIKGYTLSDLGKELDVSSMTIARWESGKFNPNSECKKKLRALFRDEGLIEDIRYPMIKTENKMNFLLDGNREYHFDIAEIENEERIQINIAIKKYIEEYSDILSKDKYEGCKRICFDLIKKYNQKYFECFKISFKKMMKIDEQDFVKKIKFYISPPFIMFDDTLIRLVDNYNETTLCFPDFIHNISESALFGNKTIEEIHINKNINKIDDNAFNYCTDLKKIYFDDCDNLTIGNHVFDNCTNLKSIFANSVDIISNLNAKSSPFINGASLYTCNNNEYSLVNSLTLKNKKELLNFECIQNISHLSILNGGNIKIDKTTFE